MSDELPPCTLTVDEDGRLFIQAVQPVTVAYRRPTYRIDWDKVLATGSFAKPIDVTPDDTLPEKRP